MAEDTTPASCVPSLERSPKIDKLAQALAKAQGLMEPAVAARENSFFNSTYADLEAVWKSIRTPLLECGLAVVQCPTTNATTGYVELTTLLIHGESGQYLQGTLAMAPDKPGAQAIGSTITYAKRYSLAAMCGVVSHIQADGTPEDDDAEAATDHTAPVARAPKRRAKKAAATNREGRYGGGDGSLPDDPLYVTRVDEETRTSKAGSAYQHYTSVLSDGRKPTTIQRTLAAEAREALSLKSRVVVTLSEPNPKHPTWAQDLLAIDPEEGASFDPISDEDLRDIADVL